MAAATVTASGGQVRSQRRARALRRGCWRLAVLLGLSWAGLLLLGGTAHAACDEPTCDQPAAPAVPEAQPGVPLVGELLARLDGTVAATTLEQVRDLTTATLGGHQRTPSADTPEPGTTDHAAAPVADAIEPTRDAAEPAASSLAAPSASDPALRLADTVRTAAGTVNRQLLVGEGLPSVRSTAVPLVDQLAREVTRSATAAVGTVEELTVALPVAAGLSPALRSTIDSTVSLATRLAVDTTHAATGAIDRTVGLTSSLVSPVLSPVLETVAGPRSADGADRPGSAAGTGTSTGSPVASDSPGAGLVLRLAAAPADAAQPAADFAARALPGPGTPPPDATGQTTPAVQPAADTTTLAVPVSGAGSITGTGGSPSVPRLDQTPVRVEGAPTGVIGTTEPVTCFSGPMPGTPAADPAFSPD